jgi:DNA gyrase subunit A
MTQSGLIKRIPTASFKTQKRNGKGVKSADDIVSTVIRTNTIDSLMVFTNKGVMYRLLVDTIPVGTNSSQGTPISSLITMESDEIPTTIYSMYRNTEEKYLLFVSKNGMVKKTSLEEYTSTKKKSGVAAMNLREGDSIISVSLLTDEEVILITAAGGSIRFGANDITATGRATAGVKGINLVEGDYIVASVAVRDKSDALGLFLENGLGKKVPLSDFPAQKRGGKGVQCYKLSTTSCKVAAATLINDDDTLYVVGRPSSICLSAKEITSGARSAIGTQLLKGSKIMSVTKV